MVSAINGCLQVVGVIGAVVTEDGEADLGPIAVVSKGRGVSTKLCVRLFVRVSPLCFPSGYWNLVD